MHHFIKCLDPTEVDFDYTVYEDEDDNYISLACLKNYVYDAAATNVNGAYEYYDNFVKNMML